MAMMAMRTVQSQLEGMRVPIFEVGAYKLRSGPADNEPEMLLRTWDRETLLRSVSWLRLQNSRGRNIFIRPKGEHPLSLVDDLTEARIERMSAEGFNPTIVVET